MTVVKYQLMPPLSPDEYAALHKSIETYGIYTPIVVDENGVVIDGHHRRKIADELGIDCPEQVKAGLSDEEKRTLALSLNLDRRHLTREQKRALIAESVKADPQLSDREHGRRTGSDNKTVAAVRSDLEANEEIPHSPSRVTTDGKPAPGPKPKRKSPTKITGEMLSEMVERYEAGESTESIGADLNVNASTVAARLRQSGVAMRSASEKLTSAGREKHREVRRKRALEDHAKMISEWSNRFVAMAMGMALVQEVNDTLTPEMARECRAGWDEAYKEIKRLRGLVIERSKETW